MSLRRALALFGLAVLGCEEPRPTPVSPVRGPTLDVIAPTPPVMECRFEPRSFSSDPSRHGSELCFTSSEAVPWWLTFDAAAGASDAGGEAATEAAGSAPDQHPPCPPEMVLVEGDYCPSVRHRCLRYLDDQGPGGFLSRHRCAEFDRKPTCAGARQARRFCIDRDEYVPEGAELPLVEQSWTMAVDLCASFGKRLCLESEWEFACEGEELRPYPYGFERRAALCNHDQPDLTLRGKLRDLRVAPASRPECVSPFGVRNLVGNVDEWAMREGHHRPWRAALRGGWWLAGRNNCRAATTGHDEYYFGPQTGVRCCKEAG